MTAILMVLLAQHAVISARAGMVTYTEGVVNTVANAHVGEGNSLITGPSGRAEIMLVPDSYLRILPYSSVLLESERLEHIVLKLGTGAAIADINEIDDDLPIFVQLDGLEVRIQEKGLYLFEPDRVAVLEGELELTEGRLRKGETLVRDNGTFSQVPLRSDIEAHPLVRWNALRTEQLVARRPRRQVRPFRF